MKKKYLALFFALLMIIGMLASCSDSDGQEVPDGMILASKDEVEYYLYVPDDWTVSSTDTVTSANASDNTSVSLMIWEAQYTDSTVDSWWEQYLDEFKATFDDFNIETEGEDLTLSTVEGELAAKKYVYTATLGGAETSAEEDLNGTFKYEQVVFVYETRIYLITFTSTEGNFETHTSEFDNIVSEFQFK